MKITLYILLLLMATSCHHKNFDKAIWNSKLVDDEITYENRYEMLDDLLENHQLKGKTIADVERIMGKFDEHDYSDQTNEIIIPILVEWQGIDPYKYKYLNLRYNSKNIIDSVYITAYKAK